MSQKEKQPPKTLANKKNKKKVFASRSCEVRSSRLRTRDATFSNICVSFEMRQGRNFARHFQTDKTTICLKTRSVWKMKKLKFQRDLVIENKVSCRVVGL